MQRSMTRPGNVMKSYETYANMLFRIAMVHLGNRQDAEEAIHDTYNEPPLLSLHLEVGVSC